MEPKYPIYRVSSWFEDETAENGARSVINGEFTEECHAWCLYNVIKVGETYNGRHVLGVRLDVEYKSWPEECFAEKDELAEYIYRKFAS